jgi:hypothetical protein
VKPFRPHFVGLPLQRSLFAGIDRLPTVLGLSGVLPDDHASVWIDADGDLYLDKADIEQLAGALAGSLTPEFLARLERSLVRACEELRETTARCSQRAPVASLDEVRDLVAELGAKVARVVPFGILTKFVPDVLYQALTAMTGEAPPTPQESPGASLTRDAYALYAECRARGFPPGRLRTEWPCVSPDVAARVRRFCADHVGFGPLRWEASGYEDPAYVFAVLEATFGGEDRAPLASMRPTAPRGADADDERAVALRCTLAVWLEFLELETWYVRHAFYVGMVPLLRRIAEETRVGPVAPDDLLFLELRELTAPAPDGSAARSRRARYLERVEDLTGVGVTAERLRSVMQV